MVLSGTMWQEVVNYMVSAAGTRHVPRAKPEPEVKVL